MVDKKYTDEEINEKFGFTENEIKLIDDTLKKFEKNSPYFKRYMFGKEDPNEVTTIEDSPKKKKKTSTKSDSSPSTSETLPKSIYDLELRRLDPNPEIPEDEKYKEEDLKNAYPDKYERFEKDGEDYSFRYWLYKELDK